MKKSNFTLIRRDVLQDPSLSCGAVGLYCEMCYYAQNSTETSLDFIIQQGQESEEEVKAYLQELIDKGYIVKKDNDYEII